MDKITLKNLELFGYHGYYAEENRLGQRFKITLEALCDLGTAGKSGELDDSVNYVDIYDTLKEVFHGKAYKLLEELSQDIAEACLQRFPIIREITLEIMKPEIAVPVTCDYFSITRTYKREELAYVALGSNLGDREGYLESALRQLRYHPEIDVRRESRIYETVPVGYADQDHFLNMVAEISTSLTPMELLAYCNHIERNLLRRRDVRWGPRTIDLDILMMGDHRSEDPVLTLPHPRMTERGFVLMPLKDLLGDTHLLEGQAIAEWIREADTEGIVQYSPEKDKA